MHKLLKYSITSTNGELEAIRKRASDMTLNSHSRYVWIIKQVERG